MKRLISSFFSLFREQSGVSSKDFEVKRIDYFSPDGRNYIPDGVHFAKGYFVKACIDNSNSFRTGNSQFLINRNKEVNEPSTLATTSPMLFAGGIIVLPNNLNYHDTNELSIQNWLRQSIEKYHWSSRKVDSDIIGGFSTGNFFGGRYIVEDEPIFDKSSICIELKGVSTGELLRFSADFLKESGNKYLIVKDLATSEITRIKYTGHKFGE
jgi:hypothetical protein